MDFKFVVVRPFGGYKAGAVIGDAPAMQAIERGEHADHVVRTLLDATPDVKEG